MAAPKFTPTPWRIERDAKMFFCVVRDGDDGREYVRSASGRVSSFRTYKAAVRARAAIGRAENELLRATRVVVAKATGSAS
jgi:hypothetical protein